MSTKSTILSQLVKEQKKNGTNPLYAVNRAGRVYWNNRIPFDIDMSESLHPGSARALEQYTLSPVSSLDSPFVIGAISAGVLGVAIIVTIMIGVWIKSKLMSQSGRHRRSHKQRSNNTDEVDSTTIVSSISTLDASASCNNPNNFSQMDSIRLDDTTLDLSLMEQQTTGDNNISGDAKNCSTGSDIITTTIEVEASSSE